jgi:hypothetical protein
MQPRSRSTSPNDLKRMRSPVARGPPRTPAPSQPLPAVPLASRSTNLLQVPGASRKEERARKVDSFSPDHWCACPLAVLRFLY